MLVTEVTISQRSQKLLQDPVFASDFQENIHASVDFETLIFWLNQEVIHKCSKKERKEVEFLLVSLRAELLHDLFLAMGGNEVKIKEQEDKTSWTGWLKFILLTAAGILVAACNGFDGIVTMLSIFSLPSIVILVSGLIFSIFSVLVFCGFDLVKVSNGLGVKLSDAYKLLDEYLIQLDEIKAIRKKITDSYMGKKPTEDELRQLERIISMLEMRLSSLAVASQQFEQALHSDNMQRTKFLVTGLAAFLFFGGGFFAGQSVALVVSGLFITSVTAAFWPVIIFSTLVGLAALSLYWYSDRPGLQKLVSSWFGLNEENVEKLCNKDSLKKQEEKLISLKRRLFSQETKGSGELKEQDLIPTASLEKEVRISKVSSGFFFPSSPKATQSRSDQHYPICVNTC